MVIGSKHLFSLPLNSTYVTLSPLMKNKLYNYVLDNGGIGKFSELVNIDNDYFYRFKNDKRCSLNFIFLLYNYLSLDLNELERNILDVVSGKNNSIGISNPKIPFKFDNKYGGRILGAIMGDGSRTKLGGITYNNQNKEIVDLVLISAKKIFGNVNFRISNKKDGTLQLDFPKIVGDIVGSFGIEKSYKTISDCFVDLSGFSRGMKINFIKQFYNDEGNVRKSDRRLQVKQTRELKENDKKKIRENIEKYAPRVLMEIRNELINLDIECTLSLECLRIWNNKIMGDFAINIYGKENLENFRNFIGFDIDYKNNTLNQVIQSYKFPSAPRNKRIEFAFKKAGIVEKKYGYITKYLLAKESKRSLKTATYFLIDMKKNGLVNVIEKPRGTNGVPLPQKYVICRK
ncbi:MAG: hypothetical protein NT129_03145 [Candidatus Aenigmarchaeota archaeon]|nr:hypothetical protein [Candidatus Aenigmarchaeota archaeon]